MAYIDNQLMVFKNMIEGAIRQGGSKGKTAMIRSKKPINLIHDIVKQGLIDKDIDPDLIFPRLGDMSPEIRLAGHIKQKDQDVCVVPRGISKEESIISWGPLLSLHDKDKYGFNYSNNTLVINVRSQLSSLAKNFDTLFERTIAEAQNLHVRYPNMVLGEVYLIPAYEYNNGAAKKNKVAFEKKHVDIEKYISFFHAINKRKLSTQSGIEGELENMKNAYQYERCALLIVDFNQDHPKLYNNSNELKEDKLISKKFEIEYADIAFCGFVDELLKCYKERFDINNIINS